MEVDLRRLLGPAPASPDRQPGIVELTTFEDVRRICLELDGTEEIVTWGSDITFRVGRKIYAIGGEGADAVSIKATIERQADLLALDSATFTKAADVGRFGWVVARLDRVDGPLLRELLVGAWESVRPRRGRRAAGGHGSAAEDVG
jgi:predicted DNA-binding protein (MmcQ/YjbR family)